MSPLKVAVLEDDKTFLTELVRNLRKIEIVEVVAYDQTSGGFVQKVRQTNPDLLILDIELQGETTTGINVADLFDIPIMFFSNLKGAYSDAIDRQKDNKERPVIEYGKTFDLDLLEKRFRKFIPVIVEYQKRKKVKVRAIGEGEILIQISDVSVIHSDKGTGNHELKFVNRKPIRTADTTFEYFRSIGFTEDQFYKFGKGHLFNISSTIYQSGCLTTPFRNLHGQLEEFKERVPADKIREVRLKFQK